jgi:AcrR family transcriptional regulator
MSGRTVREDAAERTPAPAADDRTVLRVGLGLVERDRPVPGEGLRERKKRLTRQLLSDTATKMFVARGFEEVTIADIAAACGVSEKTVWNYFPAKEILLLDVEDATADAIRREMGNGGPPVEAMLRVLDLDLQQVTDYLAADMPAATLMIHRFQELVDSVPSLRSYHRDMMDRLVDATAVALAGSLGAAVDDPEVQIAATSLLGLFRIQLRAIRRLADGAILPHELRQRVRSEVRRAATVVDRGLRAG